MSARFDRAFGLHRQGRLPEAESLYREVVAEAPAHFDALHLLGVVQFGLGRHEEALASYDRALELQPDSPAALSNRGNALQVLGRWEEALASYDRALAIVPAFADALSNRGAALTELGRLEDAVSSCERAIALKPRYAEAHYNRGNALRKLMATEEALKSYDRAIAARPAYPEAFFNRANVLQDLKHYEAAAASYARTFELGKEYPYALGGMLDARLHSCDWSGYADSVARLAGAVREGKPAGMPFPFLAVSRWAADQLQCARAHVADRHPAAAPLWTGERYRHDRIRVAYLSATFHEHAVSRLIVGVLEAHDKTRFEVSGISFGPDSDSGIRRRIRSSCERFVEVRRNSDREIARLLRDMEIDIAVDLNGHTAVDGRPGILACRPAPVQVNYLGYPGTMGAAYADYIIADRWLIPPEDEALYDEKVVRLPHSYQPNDRQRAIAEKTPTRAEAGLPESAFVFCCFNNNYKTTPEIFSIWMDLLKRVEGSVLWLLEDTAAAARNLRQEARQRGVASERLVFAPRVGMPEHLARHRLADLFLDTLPYNAHTTASDALWAGLPLVTCTGGTFAGRVAGSLLHAIGMPELIAENLPDYENLALTLATTPPMLAAVRAKLAQNRMTQPLFDTDKFRIHLEAAYAAMWQRQQEGLPPAPLDFDANAAAIF